MNNKQKIEMILKIIIIFLSSLLVLSVLNGEVTLIMIVGALGTTYISIYYWQKKVIMLEDKKLQVK